MLHTTVPLAQAHKACVEKLDLFLAEVPEAPRTGRIPLSKVLEVLGVPDTLWCLRCVPQTETLKARKTVVAYIRDTLVAAAPGDSFTPMALTLNALKKHYVTDNGKPQLTEAAKLWSQILSAGNLSVSERVFVKACIVVCKATEYTPSKGSDVAYATRISGEKIAALDGKSVEFEQHQKEFVARMLQEV